MHKLTGSNSARTVSSGSLQRNSCGSGNKRAKPTTYDHSTTGAYYVSLPVDCRHRHLLGSAPYTPWERRARSPSPSSPPTRAQTPLRPPSRPPHPSPVRPGPCPREAWGPCPLAPLCKYVGEAAISTLWLPVGPPSSPGTPLPRRGVGHPMWALARATSLSLVSLNRAPVVGRRVGAPRRGSTWGQQLCSGA